MIKVRKNMALWGAALALLGVEKPWLASVPAGQGQPDPCSGSASMPAARSPRTGIVLPKKVNTGTTDSSACGCCPSTRCLSYLYRAVKNFGTAGLCDCRTIFGGHHHIEGLRGSSAGKTSFQVIVDRQHARVLRLLVAGLDPNHIGIFWRGQLAGSSQVLGGDGELDVSVAIMLIADFPGCCRHLRTGHHGNVGGPGTQAHQQNCY